MGRTYLAIVVALCWGIWLSPAQAQQAPQPPAAKQVKVLAEALTIRAKPDRRASPRRIATKDQIYRLTGRRQGYYLEVVVPGRTDHGWLPVGASRPLVLELDEDGKPIAAQSQDPAGDVVLEPQPSDTPEGEGGSSEDPATPGTLPPAPNPPTTSPPQQPQQPQQQSGGGKKDDGTKNALIGAAAGIGAALLLPALLEGIGGGGQGSSSGQGGGCANGNCGPGGSPGGGGNPGGTTAGGSGYHTRSYSPGRQPSDPGAAAARQDALERQSQPGNGVLDKARKPVRRRAYQLYGWERERLEAFVQEQAGDAPEDAQVGLAALTLDLAQGSLASCCGGDLETAIKRLEPGLRWPGDEDPGVDTPDDGGTIAADETTPQGQRRAAPEVEISGNVRRAVEKARQGWTTVNGANIVYRLASELQAAHGSIRRYHTRDRGVLVFEKSDDPAAAYEETAENAERRANLCPEAREQLDRLEGVIDQTHENVRQRLQELRDQGKITPAQLRKGDALLNDQSALARDRLEELPEFLDLNRRLAREPGYRDWLAATQRGQDGSRLFTSPEARADSRALADYLNESDQSVLGGSIRRELGLPQRPADAPPPTPSRRQPASTRTPTSPTADGRQARSRPRPSASSAATSRGGPTPFWIHVHNGRAVRSSAPT